MIQQDSRFDLIWNFYVKPIYVSFDKTFAVNNSLETHLVC